MINISNSTTKTINDHNSEFFKEAKSYANIHRNIIRCMNFKVTLLLICAILSVPAFGLTTINSGTEDLLFAQGQTQQQQQQQNQSDPTMAQTTNESIQDATTQGNMTNQTSSMEIRRAGSQPSFMATAENNFTGSVIVDPLFRAEDPARLDVVSVTFEPNARSPWHTHPIGQLLVVTAGCGLTQVEGSPVEKICPGDVIWTPPGVKHWHGATPTTAMTHISILEHVNGNVEILMETVSDEQYLGR
jgi:quercetin dioxygenase-like cupin family protein